MKAMLLRVGIDKGTDGALSPIFGNGSFEFIPISESDPESTEHRTYKNTIGRSKKPFSTFLPKAIENRRLHSDPEFETCTYGDPTQKRRYLLTLEKDDLLVFYAGLTPFRNKTYKEGLYIVGYFTVDKVIDFNRLTNGEMREVYSRYSNNAHLKRRHRLKDLVIVVGDKDKSKLLEKPVLISQTRLDRISRTYQAVSREMEARLGISGSIQRSIPPRVIRGGGNLTELANILCLNWCRNPALQMGG